MQIIKNIVCFIALYVLIFLGQHLAQKKKAGVLLCTAGGAVAGYSVMQNWITTFIVQFLVQLAFNDVIELYDVTQFQWKFLGSIWFVLSNGIGAVIGAVLCYKWSKKIWKTREIGGNGQD